jgi:Lrp/AsnC family leucine-responsive transcriptional regulator
MKLDRYDRSIVHVLQLDGRITNSQLAETVSLSESACLRRVRALEEAGFIEGYTALINQQKAGCPVNVFVNITLDRQEQAHLHAFEEAARKVPEVMECYLMSGEYDYLLRVVLADTADFERLHSQHLTRLAACCPGAVELRAAHGAKVARAADSLLTPARAPALRRTGVGLSGLRLEIERESHLDRVGDPVGVLPVASAHAEIEPLELGRAAQRRAGGPGRT